MKRQQLFNSFWLASTTAVLATQPAWADTVQVTAVRLQPKDSGIEVILETPSRTSPQVSTSNDGQTFIADINNTQLRFPKGNTFRADNPTQGITGVTVTPLNAKSIRVAVTGKAGVPVGQMVQSDKGLVLSLTATSEQTGSRERRNLAQDNRNSQVTPGSASPTPASPVSPLPANSNIRNQVTPVPPNLIPSTNPLQFPTRPEEVRIDLIQPITLQQALEVARRNNRQLQIAELELEQTRAALREAQAERYPTISVGVGVQNTGSYVLTDEPEVGTSNQFQTGQFGDDVFGNGQLGGDLFQNGQLGGDLPNTGATGVTDTGATGVTNTGATGVTDTGATGVTNTGATGVTNTGATGVADPGTAGVTNTNTGATGVTNTSLTAQQVAPDTTEVTTPDVAEQADQLGQDDDDDLDTNSTSLTGTISLNYDLYTSGARRATIRAAEEQLRFEQLDLESFAQQLRLDVATDYYDLQQADELVRINRSAVRNAQASLRDAQALEQAGVGTRFEVLQSQVQLAQSTRDLTDSLSQQQIARRQLAATLSLPQSVTVTAAEPVTIAGLWNPTLEESIILAFRNRAELEQQLAQRNISEQRRRFALAQLGPQVGLQASYGFSDEFDDDIDLGDGYSLEAQVSLLLFDGGAARAQAQQEEANIAIAETNFADQRNNIRFEVEQAYAELLSNLENIQTTSLALEQAREALRLARLRFQAGVGTQTDVINAENDLTESEGERVDAILSYNRALAALQRAISFGTRR